MGEEKIVVVGMERGLRVTLRGLLIFLGGLMGVGALLRWDRIGNLDDVRWRVVLTVVGLAVAAWLGGIWARAGQRFVKTAKVSGAAIAFSFCCYLIVVWTSWKMHPMVWRFWWVSFVAAVTGTHIVWLRMAAAVDRRRLMRVTVGCAVFVAAMLAGLALRTRILDGVSGAWLWAVGIGGVVSVVGSVVLWLRGLWGKKKMVPRGVKIGWVVVGQVGVIYAAFYLGRVTSPPAVLFERGPSGLARVAVKDLNLQVGMDLARLRRIISPGLEELEGKAMALVKQISDRRAKGSADRYLPEEENLVRGQFMSYLAYRDALLRLVAMYAGFESVEDPGARARCMVVGYAAGAMVFEASAKMVALFKNDAMVRGKLNEADARWGLPAGMFDRILENVSNPRHSETLAEIGAYLDEKKKEWAEGAVLPTEDLAWLEGRIARSRAEVARLGAGVAEPKWKQIVARVKKDTYEPWYATQSLVSTWIGDTRLVRWEPLIRIEQIKQMEAKLQAGDILLERRNWFLSNAFLPGFWPHSALYVGRVEELEKLGLVKKVNGKWVGEGEMGKHLAEYLKKAADGEEHTVIEAISDGVVFNSLTESMHADYVAVLRPRVSEGQRAKAIAEAFGHVGKPYDFEFDFATADKLVCSEVVYRAYYGMIHLDEPWMQRIAGRWTLPPLEIARKFREERGKEGRELDFVMFLDGDVGRHEAKLAGEEVFCGTIERAKGFNE